MEDLKTEREERESGRVWLEIFQPARRCAWGQYLIEKEEDFYEPRRFRLEERLVTTPAP